MASSGMGLQMSLGALESAGNDESRDKGVDHGFVEREDADDPGLARGLRGGQTGGVTVGAFEEVFEVSHGESGDVHEFATGVELSVAQLDSDIGRCKGTELDDCGDIDDGPAASGFALDVDDLDGRPIFSEVVDMV